MQREKFSSRLGFLLISAGCAIGLGNVWRFPYVTGEYGGAALFVFPAGAGPACYGDGIFRGPRQSKKYRQIL